MGRNKSFQSEGATAEIVAIDVVVTEEEIVTEEEVVVSAEEVVTEPVKEEIAEQSIAKQEKTLQLSDFFVGDKVVVTKSYVKQYIGRAGEVLGAGKEESANYILIKTDIGDMFVTPEQIKKV